MDTGDGRSRGRKRVRPVDNLNEEHSEEPDAKGARVAHGEGGRRSARHRTTEDDVMYRNRAAGGDQDQPRRSRTAGGPRVPEEEDSFSDSSDEDDSDDDGRMTDAVVHQPVRAPPAPSAARDRPGMLRKLEVYNFLCHERLEVNFAKNITYIVGRNGSGKSAICAALQIVLGTRAGDTDRGQSLASVVRTGSTTCVLRLILSNRGTGEHAGTPPWRPDVFREEIVIERTIRVSPGGSNARQETKFYAGRPELGQGRPVAGFSADELRDLRENLVIFPGNVLMVTKQESMKRLANAQPKKLYEYFMEATLLEDTHRRVQSGKQQTGDSERRLAVARSQRKEREQRWRSLRRDVQQLRQRVHGHQELQTRVRECEYQVQWAMVLDAERAQDDQRAQIEEDKQRNRGLHEKIVRRTEKLDELQAAEAEVTNRMDEEMEELNKLKDRVREADTAMRSHRGPVHAAERTLDASRRELTRAKAELTTEQRKLEAKQRQLPQESVEAQMERARDELVAAQRERKDAIAEMGSQQDSLRELEKQVADLKSTQEAHHSKCETLRANAKNAVDTIRALESGSSDLTAAISSLGADHRRLHETLDRARRDQFTHRPIGPLAAYVRVKGGFKHWKKAAEAGIAAMRGRWIVATHRDEHTLRRLCASMQPPCNPRVIVLRPQPPHVVDSRLHPGIAGRPSVYDALEFDNEWVRQAVVSLLPLDETVLVEHRADFESVRRSHSGVTMAMDKFGGRFEVRDGDISMTPSHLQSFLGKSAVEEIRVQQRLRDKSAGEYDKEKASLEECTRELRQMEKRRATLRRRMEQIDATIKRAGTRESDARRELRRLDRLVDEHPALQDDVEMQRAEVQIATDRVRQAQEEVEQAENALDEARQQLEPYAKRHRDLLAELERFQRDTTLQDEYQRHHDRIVQETARVHRYQEELRQGEEALEQRNASFQRDLDASRDLRPKARESTGQAEPPDPSISRAEAERQLRRAKEQLEECVASSEDLQLLHQKEHELANAREEYDSYKEKEDLVKLTVKRIREQLKKRDYRLQEIAKDIRGKVAEQFAEMMSVKGHLGSLEFFPRGDGREGELRMAISPDAFSRGTIPTLSQIPMGSDEDEEDVDGPTQPANDQEGMMQDVGTLSGGEKSYTALVRRHTATVCLFVFGGSICEFAVPSAAGVFVGTPWQNLLLSIARSASFPWRVMDEFDVFMDEGTRKLAMDQIHHSMASNVIDPFGTSQLVLITPHDVSSSVNQYQRQASERHGPSRLDIRVLQLDDPERNDA